MSRQFRTYLTPTDSVTLKKALVKEFNDLVFICDESSRPAPRTISKDKLSGVEVEDAVFLLPRNRMNELRFEKIEKTGKWAVDSLTSPVVEFRHCYFNRKSIGPGRLYYTTGFYGDNETWIEKNSQFLDWAKNVFSFSKKYLFRSKELDAYLGDETLALLKTNRLEFLPL